MVFFCCPNWIALFHTGVINKDIFFNKFFDFNEIVRGWEFEISVCFLGVKPKEILQNKDILKGGKNDFQLCLC